MFEFIAIDVHPIDRLPGEWFATITSGQGKWNAPGASRGNAALNAWNSYTSTMADHAAVRAWAADRGAEMALYPWPSRMA